MEIALLILVATNLVATIWFGKQLLRREEYRIEFVSVPSDYLEEHVSLTQAESEQKEIPQPEPVAQVKKSHNAWENRKNIPLNEAYKAPEPPAPRPEGYGYVK